MNNWYPIKVKLKETGEEKIILIAGALRPSVLGTWEYIFPKEALADVLSMFGLADDGAKKTKIDKLRLATLRKLCGVKKVPEKLLKKSREIPQSIILNDSERGLSHLILSGVTCHLIGYKEDRVDEFVDKGAEGIEPGVYIQEFL